MAKARRKRRVAQHVMEDRSAVLLKNVLPQNWVVREYRPDYGLDLAVEVFAEIEGEPGHSETMGEHFFVQLKSIKTFAPRRVTVRPRMNVLKWPLPESKQEDDADTKILDVVPFKIDTDLLLTVQAMGAAVVVLLVVVALDVERVFFVCLNDYIDKILIPEHPEFAGQQTVTIRIPLDNEIRPGHRNLGFIGFLSKRAKFYSAFNLVAYQKHELSVATPDVYFPLAKHSLGILRTLDIWKEPEWRLCEHYKKWMDHLNEGLKEIPLVSEEWVAAHPAKIISIDGARRIGALNFMISETEEFWGGLMVMARTYEEICREWCLPTYFGHVTRW